VKTRAPLKSLDLYAIDVASGVATKDKIRDLYLALSTDEEFNLAVRFAHVVEAYALRDGRPFVRLDIRRPATDGRAVAGVARREKLHVALNLVLLEARREIGVHFACAFRAPHHSRRPATTIVT